MYRVVRMMDNMIVIDNLDFSYDDKVIFNNFNLSIKKGSFTTIIGKNGSGKSTLANILTGLISSNNIYIDGILLCDDNLLFIRKSMCAVLGCLSYSFICESVRDELSFSIDSSEESFNRINVVVSSLGIEYLLDRNPNDLSIGESQIVGIACALINNPKLIILDEAFSSIDYVSKTKVLNYLKKINIDDNVTILNFTNDIDESLYGSDIVVIDNGKVVLHDDIVTVYKQEKILKNVGFNLPFMVDLSNRLSYYDLVDDFIFDMDDMINLLWK
jgi:energy-coupling factor transport system ATP-binding protein